jgi:hypothetical protein
LCIAIAALLIAGCDASPSGTTTKKKSKSNAEIDFEWAMQRLRRAVEDFTPRASLGLRVKRELSYELLPPDASQPNYTARVTIKSITKYKPDRQNPARDEKPKPDRKSNRLADEDTFAANSPPEGAEGSTAFYDDDQEFRASKPMFVDSLIEAPSLKEQIVYELVYQEKRWQLVTQPEAKYEQMWFDYALQQ